MIEQAWQDDFSGAVTVCSADGTIIYMNKKSVETFEKYGGKELVGTNVLDCHPEPARKKLEEMLASGEKNAYTIEKNGIRKLIYQAPWYQSGKCCGFVELSLEIPREIQNYSRE